VSGVSEAHFGRSFKEAFGIPPHRYLLTRRIERATALLRDTDLAIAEIAFQTGWNLGTFGRTFRDVTGERARVSSGRAKKAAPRSRNQRPPRLGGAAFLPETFSATAARMSAFRASASISSPSWMSMARRAFPSRLELKRLR
jgi:hypothetical protein